MVIYLRKVFLRKRDDFSLSRKVNYNVTKLFINIINYLFYFWIDIRLSLIIHFLWGFH